jgi:hypothetical protein
VRTVALSYRGSWLVRGQEHTEVGTTCPAFLILMLYFAIAMHHYSQQSQAVTSSLSRSRKMMADQVTRMAAVAQLVGEQDQLLR